MPNPAPPDGSWLDNPKATKSVLKFLMSKLSAADLEELDNQLTGEGVAMATDARLAAHGPDLQRDFLNYAPRDRKALRNALRDVRSGGMTMDQILRADPDYGKSLEERFPDMNRLKRV